MATSSPAPSLTSLAEALQGALLPGEGRRPYEDALQAWEAIRVFV